MADILKIARDFNPKKALTHIFDKIDEIIKKVNTLWSNAPTVTPKVYKALLTQSGTNAPVATVLVNTLSGTPVWSRGAAGTYRATLTGEFPDADKFYISGMIITAVSNLTFIPISDAGSIVGYYTLYRESANVIIMETYDNTFSVVEFSTLLGGAVKLALPTIEVYP